MIDFEGRVAIVTGAGRGLGYAYARGLAARGARVVVNDVGVDRNGDGSDPEVAREAADRIRGEGKDAHPACDGIGDREGCHALVEEAIRVYGRLDIVIHNAGWVGYQPITELSPDFLAKALAIQVQAPIWLAQAAWPSMTEQGYGRIVLTTSDRAIYPQYAQRGLSAYAVSKLAAIGLMNILALEGADRGILVNAVSPVAKTRMWGVEDEPDELTPAAVAPGVLYLASAQCRQSGWILRASNGQFHAIRWHEARGVDYPRDLAAVSCATVEDVSDAWPRIASDVPEAR